MDTLCRLKTAIFVASFAVGASAASINPIEYMRNLSGKTVQASSGDMQRFAESGQRFWYLKNPNDGRRWEQYGWDNQFIWLERDTTWPGWDNTKGNTAYDATPPRSMKIAPTYNWTVGSSIDFDTNIVGFNFLSEKGTTCDSSWRPLSYPWPGRRTLVYHNPAYNLGGKVGTVDVIVIQTSTRGEWAPKAVERHWYAKGLGFVRWQHWEDPASDPNFNNVANSRPLRDVNMNNYASISTGIKAVCGTGSGATTPTPPPPAAAPTLSISRTPSPMVAGQNQTVTWTSSNASTISWKCTSSGSGFSGSGSVSPMNGSVSGVASSAWVGYPSTCVWTATGPGGSKSVTETLNTVSPSAPAPSSGLAVNGNFEGGFFNTGHPTSSNDGRTSQLPNGWGWNVGYGGGNQPVSVSDANTSKESAIKASGGNALRFKFSKTANWPGMQLVASQPIQSTANTPLKVNAKAFYTNGNTIPIMAWNPGVNNNVMDAYRAGRWVSVAGSNNWGLLNRWINGSMNVQTDTSGRVTIMIGGSANPGGGGQYVYFDDVVVSK